MNQGFLAFGSDGRHCSETRPKSKIESRLRALRRSWSLSLLRLIVLEVRSVYLRIGSILATPSLRSGANLPRGIWAHNRCDDCLENNFVFACSDNMQRLRCEFPWSGVLEDQIAALAFQNGAQWAYRTLCSEKRNVQILTASESENSIPR